MDLITWCCTAYVDRAEEQRDLRGLGRKGKSRLVRTSPNSRSTVATVRESRLQLLVRVRAQEKGKESVKKRGVCFRSVFRVEFVSQVLTVQVFWLRRKGVCFGSEQIRLC